MDYKPCRVTQQTLRGMVDLHWKRKDEHELGLRTGVERRFPTTFPRGCHFSHDRQTPLVNKSSDQELDCRCGMHIAEGVGDGSDFFVPSKDGSIALLLCIEANVEIDFPTTPA